MEKKGFLLPLLLALGAAMIYWWILSQKEKNLARAYETGQVLVARFDLPARTVIKEDLVEVIQVPRKYMQQDAYEVRSPSDIKHVANLVTAVRIPKGNQVTQGALVSLSPEAGLSVKVPPGYRGCILPMENELLRLVKPGDRVDVLVTFDAVMGDSRKEKVTATILQNVLVLGVGTNLGQGMSGDMAKAKAGKEAADQAFSDKGVLSLALNPNEAQYLSLSAKTGDVSVVVRGLGDIELHPMEIASFRKLIK
ncbi:MAG TPA: Flp pilus assembly protein CpaB [Elusimicrobiales bacterium]|nr:Flp pilus assembly protein CpaB [Elusimicrobiales bacterium]